jgi:hypothetical protein
MPVVPTTAYSQAEDALNLARALMNDSAAAVFTDTLLLPFLNSAYRGLQRELAESGVSVLAEQQDLDLEPNSGTGVTNTEISDVSSPQLPTDCLMPHTLWERATANTSDVFVPMEKFTSGGAMLNLQPSSYLRLWEWREDKINLIGCHGPNPLRARAASDCIGHGSDSDSVCDGRTRVCNGRTGGAVARRACISSRPAWHGADGDRRTD